jgi:hypothetical protein
VGSKHELGVHRTETERSHLLCGARAATLKGGSRLSHNKRVLICNYDSTVHSDKKCIDIKRMVCVRTRPRHVRPQACAPPHVKVSTPGDWGVHTWESGTHIPRAHLTEAHMPGARTVHPRKISHISITASRKTLLCNMQTDQEKAMYKTNIQENPDIHIYVARLANTKCMSINAEHCITKTGGTKINRNCFCSSELSR